MIYISNDDILGVINSSIGSNEKALINLLGDELYDGLLILFKEYEKAIIPKLKNIMLTHMPVCLDILQFTKNVDELSIDMIPEFAVSGDEVFVSCKISGAYRVLDLVVNGKYYQKKISSADDDILKNLAPFLRKSYKKILTMLKQEILSKNC